MRNLKPSQLPMNTVIDDERYGEYIKRADGIWEETSCDYMGDRERVTDVGYDKNMDHKEWYTRYGLCDRRKSDDYFAEYEVVAVPPGFVFVGDAESIHGPLLDVLGGYADGTRVHDCKGYNCNA